MPLQHRHEYAAVLLRGLRAGEKNRSKESRTQSAVASSASVISGADQPRRLMTTTCARRHVTAEAKRAPRRRSDRSHTRSLFRNRRTNTSAGRGIHVLRTPRTALRR
ncbi:MAG: hypothetical protein M3198_01665 [Actinomycetota bacterium]|nr:hypothetical protein [Actinomycetota bacterium]